MRSIVALLGGQSFPRLRVGIGNVPPRWDAANYVLGRFTKEEQAELPDVVERAADAIEVILREGFVTAMNKYN
jgi:PTH1 family peptidyl-tRNA hydrolase